MHYVLFNVHSLLGVENFSNFLATNLTVKPIQKKKATRSKDERNIGTEMYKISDIFNQKREL